MRVLIIICVLLGAVLAFVIAGANPYPSIAVWLAPAKSPDPSASMSEKAKAANAKFWEAFHAGLEALTAPA